jgi:hypothetical protein
MSEEINILKLVCKKLEQANVPYMITGSFAANFYAIPRMTRDLDVVIEVQRTDAKLLFQIFQNEFYIDQNSILEAIEHQGMFNIIHNDSVFKIDFIIRKDSNYREIEFKRKQKIELDGVSIWVVAPEDLIISKLAWAKESFSEMQLGDIRNLFRTIKTLDRNYIDKWVKNLELNQVYEKANVNE